MTTSPLDPDLERAGPRVLKVSELNEHLKGVLAGLGRVAVEGEVAGFKRAASGHLYFNLKDRRRGVESVLSCAVWRSQVERATRGPLREGDQVVCHGRLDLYAPRGSYSLIVERVESVGVGALLARLEELKRELAEKGWFERRRPLPRLPRIVGVVTSRDGAAFQDFLRTRSLRWPLYPVRLRHTPVQGPGAAEEIARAVADLDASGVDVIVVCRGGGSLEDLWAFNERPVAEAIWAASVPVVSGVGHETDVTLADLVADHRAHTPTDAAQTVIPDRAALRDRLERAGGDLVDGMEAQLDAREERLLRLAAAPVLRDPAWILDRRREDLSRLAARAGAATERRLEETRLRLEGLARALLAHAPARRLERDAERLESLARRLGVPPREGLARAEARLELAAGRLEAFSPFAVLRRGYSITRTVGGAPLTGVEELEPGARLETLLADGRVLSVVESASDEGPSAAPATGEPDA
jgi:exodeoxyribonuclease VII large subunit